MPRIRTAHKFSERQRTGDVLTDELVDFSSLLLSSDVLKGLNSSGFERPSPIQLRAIPLGRCGLDLIAQAKSGTGKTCVFSVIALEGILLDSNTTQVLVLAPTREIAVQIKDVLSAIGSQMAALQCHAFIGGIHVDEDKKVLRKPCHIAVGTPGRVKFLIENHFLKTESVRLFILDEADKLLDESFQEQINWIFSSLPPNKQMMAFSATYPEYLANHLTRYMREPTFVRLNAADPTLQGLKQFYQLVPFHSLPHKTFQEKVSELLKLLSRLSFHQCLVFSNYQIRAQSLCETLCSKGWPSVFIAGSQTQAQRLKAMEKLKQFKCRVLISTDLTSRGIDAEHVNLVVNMDVPRDSETYLHRIGRAGRFGTQGIAVTFVAKGDEEKLFKTVERNIGVTIDLLPDNISQSFNKSSPSEMSNDPVLTTTQPTTSSVEVDILKSKSASQKPRINSQLENKTQSPMRNSDSEVVLDVGEKVEDSKLINNLEEQRATVTEVENLPEQQLKLKDTQSGCDNNISLRNKDMRDEAVNCELEDKCLASEHHVSDCREQNLEDEKLSFENDSTSPKDGILWKLHELNIGCTGPESSNHVEDPINKCCHEEKCDAHNVCTRSSLEDGITNHKKRNKKEASILYEVKSPALVFCDDDDDDDDDGKETTQDSDSLDSLSSSSSTEELHSCNLLPPVGEFDRDFEEYLQSASSFLVAEEKAVDYSNSFPSKEYELQGQSDSEDDIEFPEHQLRDIDSENFCHASQGVTHANHPTDHRLRDIDSDNICHASQGVTHANCPTDHRLCDIDSTNFCHASHGVTHDHTHYATSDDSLTPGVYSQSMDAPPVPYNQYQGQDGNYYNEPINWQQMAHVNTTDEYNSSHLEPQPSWNSYPYFPATNSLHPFDDEYCSYSHYYNQADYYAGSFANDWRTCGHGAEMCSETNFATDQHSAMPTQHEEAHVCDDNQSQQESQWNASWYNAYWRQTNCIKQFVAFNRSFRI